MCLRLSFELEAGLLLSPNLQFYVFIIFKLGCDGDSRCDGYQRAMARHIACLVIVLQSLSFLVAAHDRLTMMGAGAEMFNDNVDISYPFDRA